MAWQKYVVGAVPPPCQRRNTLADARYCAALFGHGDTWGTQLIKSGFTRGLPGDALRTQSKFARRERGIWQRRYWEHAIRDDADLMRHVDYVHFNPVKHGYVSRVCDWPHGSFHRYVERGLLPADWGGDAGDVTSAFGER